MADDVWTSLFEDIQLVLYPDWDDDETLISPTDGDSLQLRDTLTGQRILFREDDKGLDIRVTVPDEPVTAARLRAVIQSQRTTLFSQVRDRESGRWVPRDQPLWKSVEIHIGRDHDVEHEGQRVEEYAREWRTGWRHNADDQRYEIAAAIVAVLRDGLGTTPDRLRVSSYNDFGPTRTQAVGEVASDRPTLSGLPARCSGWDEFVTRFEWVLATLPWLGNVILDAPQKGSNNQVDVQFYNSGGGDIDSACGFGDAARSDLKEINRLMSVLGWQWTPDHHGAVDAPIWLGPPTGRDTTHPTMHELAVRTMVTLRDVAGVAHPNELAFTAFSNAQGVDDMSYVGAELGIAPA
ncbi:MULTISPECIES: hypothetical protein [unclassified Rhodococcus (in: high G+C Gram-positive bacteria)]|uniref:TY-Chap domain-containing protein n=1 Tax=unclassified Rhodococcus (in: high G+C Gram-positive bacteria) TaxID=192944 RepID=UPI0005E626CB|nr:MULTISPECIES: hypothetical protein [unclassified Rhodococcus (in: high G+C Gram-positive bacteria)]KJF22574.1 hypothetical protein SZ00_03228 [Rhodococcus sp. AD45]